MIHVALRLDDPSETSDHGLERSIIGCLARHGLPATFAVIPFRQLDGEERGLSAEKAAHLVDAARSGHIEIALHGLLHECRRRLPDGNATEFAGERPDVQRERIRRGRTYLETLFEQPVNGFVPPWNSYDGATLQALGELDFHYLSASWDTPPGATATVHLLPHGCNLPHLRQAVEEARQLRGLDVSIVVIMHHYDFIENDAESGLTSLAGLDTDLAWLAAQDDVVVSTLGEHARRLAPRSLAWSLRYHRWKQGLHWRVQALLPRYSLFAGDGAPVLYTLGRYALRQARSARAAWQPQGG